MMGVYSELYRKEWRVVPCVCQKKNLRTQLTPTGLLMEGDNASLHCLFAGNRFQ